MTILHKFQIKDRSSGYVFTADKSKTMADLGDAGRGAARHKGTGKKTAEGYRITHEADDEIKLAFEKYQA